MTISAALDRAGANRAPGQSWYRIENRAGSDTAEVYIYDEIGMFGITADGFVKELCDIKAPNIELHLNTPGGEVFEGFAIYNALRHHKAEVTVYIDGLAASAGSFIAMAGDRVVAEPISQMMIHSAHGIGFGDAEDMIKAATRLNELTDTIAGIYAEKAGGSMASWRDKMRAETWFNATEALKAGLVDEIAEAPAARARGRGVPDNSWDLSNFMFAGREKAPDPFAAVTNTAPAVEPVETLTQPPPPPAPPIDLASLFDRQLFAEAVQSVAGDAPAAPASEPRPVDLGPPLPEPPAPIPEPEPNPWETIRHAMALAANSAPAPPEIQSPESPAIEPGFSMNASAFRAAIKEAVSE